MEHERSSNGERQELPPSLTALLDDVTAVRDEAFWRLSGDGLLDAARVLERAARVVFAAQVRLAGEIDAQGLAQARSCPSTSALLRLALNISAGDAGARVRAARMVLEQDLPSGSVAPAELPAVGAALDEGLIGPEHVRSIVATMHRLPGRVEPETRVLAEKHLVEAAMVTDPRQLDRIAQHLEEIIDPDGRPDPDEAAAKMELQLGRRNPSTGLTPLSGRLDDVGVGVLRAALDGLSAPQPEVDGVADARPAATRRAHALVEALRRGLDAGVGPATGGAKPHLVVHVDWDLLRGGFGRATFDDGQPLTPAQLRRLACDADVLPAVLGGPGQVLDLGRSARTFPPALRRALAVRDKGCAFPGCDRPPGWCDAHHIAWWDRDLGHTCLDNGVLLCRYHHTEIHKGEWHIRLAADRKPQFLPPTWIDPQQRPRRNTLHDWHLVL